MAYSETSCFGIRNYCRVFLRQCFLRTGTCVTQDKIQIPPLTSPLQNALNEVAAGQCWSGVVSGALLRGWGFGGEMVCESSTVYVEGKLSVRLWHSIAVAHRLLF